MKIIIVLIILLFLLVFVYVEPLITKNKIKNDNEYGSARFSNFQEIKNNFRKEKINNIVKSGFPIYYSKNLKKVYFDTKTPHYIYLGSTGSGKSVTAVIPTCAFISSAKNKKSVFITDPKGEIFETTSKMFSDRGYKIITIDFRNPELSNRINILEPIIVEYEKYIEYERLSLQEINENKKLEYNNFSMNSLAETYRLISSLSSLIMQEKQEQKDPFWNESAKNLLEGLIGFFLEEYKAKNITRNQITMTSIKKFQNSTMENKNSKIFKDYINSKSYGLKSKDSLISILSASDNTYKSITAVFGQKMNIFDDINVANITSNSDFNFNILGKEPVALYVIVPDEDKTYFPLITIITGMLYKELIKLANINENKKLKCEIDFILDEFANCPPLPDIESIVSVARSRGMHFHFFIQSFSQLENVYGKNVSQIILDNCGLMYLKTNTQETAELISKRLGKKTIESSSIRHSISLTNYNGDESTNLIGRELMMPEEIKQLHYKTIIFPIIGFPIIRDTVIYNKVSCYRSGYIKRNVIPLKDLSKTYFTVENIKYDNNSTNKSNPKEILEFYDSLENSELEKLKLLEPIIKKLFKKDYKIKYNKTDNGNRYVTIIMNKRINQIEKMLIYQKIKPEEYHIEIFENNEGTIINIYNENLINSLDKYI